MNEKRTSSLETLKTRIPKTLLRYDETCNIVV